MWRKAILAIASMVACIILLIAAVPASDAVETGGGVEDIPSSNEVTYSVQLENPNITYYDSNTYNDLKQNLIVSDSQGKVYSSDEFQIKGANEADRLTSGSLNVVIVVNNAEVSLENSIVVSRDVLEDIDISVDGRIYATDSINDLKEKLNVTGIFQNIKNDDDPISFEISSWNQQIGDNTILISVVFNGKSVQKELSIKVFEKKVVEIIDVDTSNIPDIVDSSTQIQDLKDYLSVKVKYEDGSSGTLSNSGYEINGSLLVTGDSAVPKTLYVSIPNNDEVESFDFTVNVQPVSPMVLVANVTEGHEFTAFDNQNVIRSNLSVSVIYDGTSHFIPITEYVVVTEQIPESGDPVILPEQKPISLNHSDDDVTIFIYAMVSGELLHATVDIAVNYLEIEKPQLSGSPSVNYDGSADVRTIIGYDAAYTMIINPSTGLDTSASDKAQVSATNVGIHSFVVQIIDKNNCCWADGTFDDILLSWEIMPASLDAIDLTIESWTYKHPFTENDFRNLCDISVQTTGVEWAEENNGDIQFQYYGVGADGTVIGSAGNPEDGFPADAGTWHVRGFIPESAEKNFVGIGNYSSVTVNKAVVPDSAVIISSATYNGGSQQMQYTVSDTYQGILIVPTTYGTDADSYDVTVSISSDYSNNYCWDVDSPNNPDRVYIWTIGKCPISLTTDYYISYTGGDVTLKINVDEVVKIAVQGVGLSLNGSQLTISNAIVSDYHVAAELSNSDNYMWLDGTPSATRTITVHVQQATNSVSVTLAGWTYSGWSADKNSPSIQADFGGDAAILAIAEKISGIDAKDADYTTIGNIGAWDVKTVPTEAGEYWLRVEIGGTANYSSCVGYTSFIISEDANSIKLTINGWIYNEYDPDSNLPKAEADHGLEHIQYFYASREVNDDNGSDNDYGSEVPENAGLYWLKAYIPGNGNYSDATAYVQFEIERKGIPAPDIEYPETGNVYTGEQIKVNAGEYDTYTVDSGNSGVEAGPYKMVVSPKSNYKWSDLEGQSALGSREITWVIDRRPIAPSGERNLEYDNGTNLYPEITATYNGASVSFTPSWENTSEINAEGSYYTGKLKLDNTNFRWTQSNQSYIVNGSVVVTDSVSEDGNTITIWYRITQEQYELEIKIQDGPFDYTSGTPTFAYNGSFPSISVDSGVAIVSSLPSEVQGSNSTLYIVDSGGNIMDKDDSADVGTYFVYLVIDETDHYAQGESNRAMFKIVEADIKIKSGLNDCSTNYTGESLSSVLTDPVLSIVDGNNPIITYSDTKDGIYSSKPPSFTDVLINDNKVSGYTVYYKIEADNYNPYSGSFVFTVEPAAITVTVKPWTNIDYSGSAPDLDASNHWDITQGLDNGDDLELSFTTEGVVPGIHDVICESSNTNYDVKFVGTKTCTIVPATILTFGNFVGYNGQYDGSNHSVVVTIPIIQTVSGNYTIHYSWNYSTNCDDYKESSLSIRDVPTSEDHTLTVYYAIKEDYHNSVLGSFNVTVNPKPLTLTVNDASVQYGYDPAFSVTYSGFVESDNPAELLENIQYTHSYTAGKANSGNKFSVYIVEDSLELDNYEITKYPGTLTVIDRVICISMDSNSYEYTYDEQPESIPQNYNLVWGEFYSDDKDVFAIVAKDTNGNTMSPKLDVGQYYLVPEVSNDNYTIEMQSQVNYIITATTLTINFSAYDKTYDGTAKIITATAADHGDVTVEVTYYEVVDGNEIELPGAPTDAGNYKVKANVVSTKNYTAGSASMEMVIDQATITVSSYSGVSAGMTFSGSGSQYTGKSMVPGFGGQVILSGVKSFDIGNYIEGVGFVLNAVDVLDTSFSYYAKDGTTSVSELINAGTYKFAVNLSLKATFEKNFLCPADPEMQTFVIDQRDVNVVWNEMNFDYLGQDGDQSLNGIVSFIDIMDEGVVYTPDYRLYIVDGTDRVEITSDNFVNANTYTLDVEIIDNNYDLQSHATQNYTIKPLQITITANPVDGVTFGDIKVNENLSSYNGYVPSGDSDAVSIFNSEASSYIITYSVRSNLSAISNYVTAATHEDAILIHYSGSGNFDVNAVPGDLTVSKRTVHIDVLDQEYDYTGGTITPSSDPRYYVVDILESLGLNLGVTIIHGTSGVAADHGIMDFGTHNLTCVISNANYEVAYTDSDGESMDGVLKVRTANNYWNPDDEFGINGWVFGAGPGVDGVDFPSSIFGTVTATIIDSAGQSVNTFTASDVGSVAFDTMNAGEYTIVFYVAAPDSHNYTGLTGSSAKTYPFTIDQKPLDAWWADDDGYDRFVYDPDVSRSVQLYGYDSKIMSLGDLDSDHPHAEVDGKITMTETEGGTYGVVLTITDENDNYCWKDTSGDVLRVVWEISSIGENFWIVDPSIPTEWQYGEEIEYTAGVAVHGGAATVMFYYSSGAEYGQTVPTEIGQYYMLASVAETGSYDGIEERIDFTITKKTFVKPDVEAKTFAYNGGETVIFDVESYDWFTPLGGYVSYSGNTGSEPGKYSLVLYLDNAHSTSWDDGSTDPLIIEWMISSAGEIIESMFEVDESSVAFSGHPIVKSVNATNLTEGTDYVVSYSNNINSGTAKVIITGVGAYSGQLEYEFSIKQATGQPEFYNEQLKMYVEDSSFYNALQLPSYIDESLLTYTSSDSSIATVDPHTGAITMNATGTVTITASYPGTANYSAGSATYELTVSDTPVEVVDHVVYIRVPVTDPDDPDDPADDKPEEPAIVYKNDNTLYIILLLVLAVVCVCFAAYIMYTHRKQENQGGGQR